MRADVPATRALFAAPWEMTVTPVPGAHSGRFEIPLPAKPYVAVRAVKAE